MADLLTVHVEENPVEAIAFIWDLLPRHYASLSLHKQHGIPLDPDLNVYYERGARGQLMIVTLRKGGDVVGYFVGFLVPAMHYRTCLTLVMDIFYVDPRARGKKDGVQGAQMLLAAARAEAKRRGARVMTVSHKERHKLHITRLFAEMGFTHEESSWWQWLDDTTSEGGAS